jgi:hypothetical protein
MNRALTFAEPFSNEVVGVLLIIEITKKNNYFIYNKENTAFSREDEVLLNEGLTFQIKKIE